MFHTLEVGSIAEEKPNNIRHTLYGCAGCIGSATHFFTTDLIDNGAKLEDDKLITTDVSAEQRAKEYESQHNTH